MINVYGTSIFSSGSTLTLTFGPFIPAKGEEHWRNKLFRSAKTHAVHVTAVFFPAIRFLPELLQPPIFEHYVDCALRIFHIYSFNMQVC